MDVQPQRTRDSDSRNVARETPIDALGRGDLSKAWEVGRHGCRSFAEAVGAGCWFFVFDTTRAAAKKKLRHEFAAVIPYQKITDVAHASALFRAIRLEWRRRAHVVAPRTALPGDPHGNVLKMKKCLLTGELQWAERRFGPQSAA